jgi:hypothetical protein
MMHALWLVASLIAFAVGGMFGLGSMMLDTRGDDPCVNIGCGTALLGLVSLIACIVHWAL